MSNELYPLARQAFGNKLLDWVNDDHRIVLLDGTYVYNDTDEFHSDLTGILATSANLTGETNVLGVMDADDVTLSAVAGGDTINYVVVYHWSGSSATSRLLCFFDRLATAELIDVETDGGNVQVRWSNGSTKIFRL